jgi:hypothetical protein
LGAPRWRRVGEGQIVLPGQILPRVQILPWAQILPWGQIVRRDQQLQRLEAHEAGEALDALEREVALAALDATEIGGMDGKRPRVPVLALSETLSVSADVAAHGALEIAFHAGNAPG